MTDLNMRTGEPPDPGTSPVEGPDHAARSTWRLAFTRFRRHRLAMGSLALFVLLVVAAFLGPELWRYDHRITPGVPSSEPPSLAHPLGTTSAGHDVLGQVIRGTQQSLKVALTVALTTTVIGGVWGAIAGFYRGAIDAVMMRFVDVILIVPLLVVVTAMAGNFGAGTTWWAVALVLGLFGWPVTARVVRGVVLSLREREFVEATRAMGASDARIIFLHLLPNAAGVIIVAGTLSVAFAILAEAALSFLGFGIRPPDISLGLLIEYARTAPFTRPWLFYPPGLLIVSIALTINFIGDGLRDALDPRQTMVRR